MFFTWYDASCTHLGWTLETIIIITGSADVCPAFKKSHSCKQNFLVRSSFEFWFCCSVLWMFKGLHVSLNQWLNHTVSSLTVWPKYLVLFITWKYFLVNLKKKKKKGLLKKWNAFSECPFEPSCLKADYGNTVDRICETRGLWMQHLRSLKAAVRCDWSAVSAIRSHISGQNTCDWNFKP